jgi:hypothetical protein
MVKASRERALVIYSGDLFEDRLEDRGFTIPPNVLARVDRVIREASAKAGGR